MATSRRIPRFPDTAARVFGRTRPQHGRAVREGLRDRIETLEARDLKFRRFPALAAGRSSHARDTHLYFRSRPLPPLRLPDGTRPFARNKELNPRGWYGGTIGFRGRLRDPLLPPLWRAGLELRPANAILHVGLKPPDRVDGVSISVDLPKRNGPAECEVGFSYWLGDHEPGGLVPLVEALGLERFARPGDLDPAAIAREAIRRPGHHRASRLALGAIPAEPDLPGRWAEGVERLGWSQCVDHCAFFAAESEESYERMRSTLNAIAGDWTCDFDAWYAAGFDPFQAPPEPPAGEEYRYPIAERDPYLDVDVVHSPEGSYLEFYSSRGEKPILYYADLADAEDIELWSGEPADRWG